MKPIKVLLVEDHVMVREGLHAMLELEPDIEVVGEAQTGRDAVTRALELRPDVVLMDIAMPDLNGLEATRQLLKRLPLTKVVILTAHSDDAYVTSAADAGATGFLLKQDTTREVCFAVREAHMGRVFCSSSVARRLSRLQSHGRERSGKSGAGRSRLTSREMEVLQLIAEGKPNKETAADLGISIKTVEKHRGHLMSKLDIHDTAGLTRYAIATGIVVCSAQVTIL